MKGKQLCGRPPTLLYTSFTIILSLTLTGLYGGVADAAATSENYSKTTIQEAAKQGNINAVRYFTERGDDVNAVTRINDCNCTALVQAAENGHLGVVKYLLDHNADVNKKVNYSVVLSPTFSIETLGVSPLRAAVGNRKNEVAKLLIDRGADLTAVDNNGWSPLYYAAVYNNLDVLTYLLNKHADPHPLDKNGNNLLNVATTHDNVDMAKLLIERGLDFDTRNLNGQTPLFYATVLNKPKVAELLLSKGADVRKYDISGNTPLHNVVLPDLKYTVQERVHMLNIILKHKKELIDVRNFDKELGDNKTALHFAVEAKLTDVVKVLIDAGADINSQTAYLLNTPLHLAAAKNDFDLVKFLIQHGADFALKNKNGKTPLELLSSDNRSEIDKLINGWFKIKGN